MKNKKIPLNGGIFLYRYGVFIYSSYCARQRAVMASTTGTALTATHASWRPTFVHCTSSLCKLASAFGVVGVGLKTQRKVMVVPSAIPPAMPPDI